MAGKKARWLIVLGIVLIMPLGGNSADHFPDSTLREIIVSIMNNEFSRGDSLVRELIQRYPDRPWGYFYRGAILQAQMIDRNALTDTSAFWEAMDRCIGVVETREREGKATAMDLFFKGSAYYYMAFHHMKLGHWWQAYRNTRKGVHILEQAVQQDSSLWDAYLGIGAYKFWKSQKAGLLRFLLFIKNEKAKGLAMVRQAVQRSHLVPELARDQLVYMLMDDGQVEEAWQLAQKNLQLFPHSRFFLWTYAKASFKARKWKEAYKAYRYLWQYIQHHADQKRNLGHVAVRLARCACELGKVAAARNYFSIFEKEVGQLAPYMGISSEEWQVLQQQSCLMGHTAR